MTKEGPAENKPQISSVLRMTRNNIQVNLLTGIPEAPARPGGPTGPCKKR